MKKIYNLIDKIFKLTERKHINTATSYLLKAIEHDLRFGSIRYTRDSIKQLIAINKRIILKDTYLVKVLNKLNKLSYAHNFSMHINTTMIIIIPRIREVRHNGFFKAMV